METVEFSFEDSLKYLDDVVQQMNEEAIPHCDTFTDADLLAGKLVQANCTAMYVKVVNKTLEGKVKEFVFHTVMSLIMKIINSEDSVKRVEFQTGGGLLAMFDTPMKKDVENLINLSARLRSINDVVLKRFGQDMVGQSVSVGIDFGPVEGYCLGDSIEEYFFAGEPIETAKKLAEAKKDCVSISESIFINLPEELTTKLFDRSDKAGELEYHYSRLINIMMQKWIDNQEDKK